VKQRNVTVDFTELVKNKLDFLKSIHSYYQKAMDVKPSYFARVMRYKINYLASLLQEAIELSEFYSKETGKLFYAELVNKMQEEKRKANYRGIGELIEVLNNDFFYFFPKKFNRLAHDVEASNDFNFKYFNDIR
jgi:hypothetical protein